jgi:hypothetical protein
LSSLIANRVQSVARAELVLHRDIDHPVDEARSITRTDPGVSEDRPLTRLADVHRTALQLSHAVRNRHGTVLDVRFSIQA